MFKNRMQELQNEAEQFFNNYQDDSYDDGYDDFDGFDSEGYDADGYDSEGYDAEGFHYSEYEESYSSQGGLGAAGRTLNVVISNATALVVPAVKLFAPFRANATPAGITITVDGTPQGYLQLQEELKSNPYTIKGLVMRVANSSQFSNKLTFTQYESTGEFSSAPFIPANYIDARNFIQTQISAKNLNFLLSGKHELSLDVNASENINLILTVFQKTDIANLSMGKSVLVGQKRRKKARRPRRK